LIVPGCPALSISWMPWLLFPVMTLLPTALKIPASFAWIPTAPPVKLDAATVTAASGPIICSPTPAPAEPTALDPLVIAAVRVAFAGAAALS